VRLPANHQFASRSCRFRRRVIASMAAMAIAPTGCYGPPHPTIAVIARTSGTMMSESEHGGAMVAADPGGAHVYWNAPTREDDIQGQIAMVERVAQGSAQGLVLLPDHASALVSPVRNALARGIPTVIVSSPLTMPAGGHLFYLLNDDAKGGELGARRLASILHGKGKIVVLGIDPEIVGVVTRARSLEETLGRMTPEIRVVSNSIGSFNVPHEQQMAEEALKAHPDLDVMVTMTAVSEHGALSALATSGNAHVKVIAYDPNDTSFDAPALDSFILQDTRTMGDEAVRTILASLNGLTVPAVRVFPPTLVTHENAQSPEVRRLSSMEWRTRPLQWTWNIGP
jgi:ribose transport system substrate-binding protein